MTAADRAGELLAPDLLRIAAVGREHFGFESPRTASLPGAVCASERGRTIAIVDETTMAVLGGVLLWAQQEETSLEAVIVTDTDQVGVVDGWLGGLASPPNVRGLAGRQLVPPGPAPEPVVPPPPAVPLEFAAADVEVVVEHGMVLAEVAGLEVARAFVGTDGEERIAIGVGQYDRAAHDVMTAGRPLEQRLAAVVEGVRRVRRPSAAAHTFNRLCRERWLRSALVADPGLVGLVELRPTDPVPPRASLLDRGPAPAIGTDPAGATVLVMATAGIDPGVVPATSAVAGREEPDRIIVALPPRDVLGPITRVLGTLRWPVETVALDPPWG